MRSLLRSPFAHRASEPLAPPAASVTCSYGFEGVTFTPSAEADSEWLRKPLDFKGQESMVAFLAQAEEEGFARLLEDWQLRFSWEAVYEIARSAEHREGLSLMGLPPIAGWRPRLESVGGLADKDFAILLAGWITPLGERATEDIRLSGAMVTWKAERSLLSEQAWLTVEAIAVFHRRWLAERTGDGNRRGWARIRKHALAAGSDLSNFLAATVVLTPDKLRLQLRKAQTGARVIEVIPEFDGAPTEWIHTFDRGSQVLERYDIPQGSGIVQVMLAPEVQAVLREIKALPGRRVAGARAEAFVRNPFATLGPDASTVLDPAEFEAERERAGLAFARFAPTLLRDPQGMLREVALDIQESKDGSVATTRLGIVTAAELSSFVSVLQERISQEAQCCPWKGYELEILGETQGHLTSLESALAEWRRQEQFTLGEILDLSCYSERIAGIGVEDAGYSPFLSKEKRSEWFPEEVDFGLLWQPGNGGEPVAIRLSEEAVDDLRQRLQVAQKQQGGPICVPGLPAPLAVEEARRILFAFAAARQDVAHHAVPEERLQPVPTPPVRRQLVMRSNVETVDYEERRGALTLTGSPSPRKPAALKPEMTLRPHQWEGFAWLTHLFNHSPVDCRGALLADEMGLGKTLQILAFVAHCLEAQPQADPILIVAPVALLENWQEEMEKFFMPGALPVLPLYGPALAARRLPQDAVDAQIGQAGLGKLLVRNWLGNARLVLTTYETLRDLEFSLARHKWSVMICDEAQKIKNPNSLVSRAARKQNARFKIACTGTPVENSLTDLWCLFDFIQPGLLGALATFGKLYKRPIEARSDEEKQRLQELRALIAPQKLRRTKAEIARDLPQRTVVDSCRKLLLSARQRLLYGQALRAFREQTASEPQSAGATLKLLALLRLVCTHPQTPEDARLTELEEHSPKMRWLLAELAAIQARQEKAIIFCELRELQRILQRAVGERFRVIAEIINGQTSTASGSAGNRQQKIAQFQSRPGFGVIILSPLAAGFGLNIQAANHVIHFTRSWNPAKEDQATDRAHRIGQTREVFVYYPVVTAPDFRTVDAVLDTLLDEKRALSRDMLNGASEVVPEEFGTPESL